MRTPTDGSRPRPLWTYLVSGLAVFMVSMDNLVVTNALPVIRADLGTGIEGLEWTVNAYTLTFAVFLLTGAALGDRFGRRLLFTAGLVVFTSASAAAALSGDIGALVAARAVQGLGAAVIMPLTLTLLVGVAPPERRGAAFGAWGAMSGLGVALGPVIGGAITEYSSWQWIFWINVPVGVLLLPLMLLVRESRGGAGRLDLLGTALVTVGLFGIVYALIQGNSHGWTSGGVLAGFVGGALGLAAFVWWQLRAAAPMVPPSLFHSRGFTLGNLVGLGMTFGVFGSVFLLAQFLQGVQGYSPLDAGLRTLPWTGMPALVAPVAGLLADRIGARRIVAAGLALQAIGLAWCATLLAPDTPYPQFIVAFLLSGAGLGMFYAPITKLILGFAPESLAGVASGVSNAIRQVGTVLGIAVLGAVFATLGGFADADDFIDGAVPATIVGATALAVAAVLTMLISERPPAAEPAQEPAGETAPEPAGETAAEPAGESAVRAADASDPATEPKMQVTP